MVTLAACLRFKNEASYLREWIEYHRLVGVERFYLYNHWSTDAYRHILEPYIRDGIAVLHQWRRWKAHPSAAMHCVRTYRDDAQWIAFIDADEFLVPRTAPNIPVLLDRFTDFPGLALHRITFGSSGHVTMPRGLVLENYFQCAPVTHHLNQLVKCVVNPREVVDTPSTHLFHYRNDASAVNEKREPVRGIRPEQVTADDLCIFHYFCKSREEGERKCARGHLDWTPRRTMEQWEGHDRECSSAIDRTMERFLPSLRQRMTTSLAGSTARI
jgi:hypothetical protein